MTRKLESILLVAILAATCIIAANQLLHGETAVKKGALTEKWQYEAFQFKDAAFDSASGKQILFSVTYSDMAQDANGKIVFSEIKGRECLSIADLLSQVGSDGWKLAAFDGKNYIVSRPEGKWEHNGFSVSEEPAR